MLVACIVTGKRRAVFCDSTGRDRPRRLLTSIPKRVFFSLCDGYFGFGERSREYLLSLGAKRESIFVPCQAAALPRSFSPERALDERVARARRQSAGVSVRGPSVGREGHRHADRGVRRTCGSVFRQAKLRIVGTGPMASTLHAEVAETRTRRCRDASSAVCRTKRSSREYFGATCMVLPSYSEPWGLVVNEALAMAARRWSARVAAVCRNW